MVDIFPLGLQVQIHNTDFQAQIEFCNSAVVEISILVNECKT